MEKWPFADPPNVATITVRQITDGLKPVLLVVHDAEEGDWQFVTGEPFDASDGLLVTLRSMIERDPSLAELADLPLGWRASRENVGVPWRRSTG